MAKPFTRDQIEQTKKCIFGLVYAIVLFFFVALASSLIFVEFRAAQYEKSLAVLQKGNNLLASMEIELRYVPGNGTPKIINYYTSQIHSLLKETEGTLGETFIDDEIRKKISKLNDFPSEYTILPAGSAQRKVNPFLAYKNNFLFVTRDFEQQLSEDHALAWVLLLSSCSLAALALGSVPVANYLVHTVPLQRYARALLGYGESSEKLTGCSYGIVRLFGGIVQTTVDRQEKTQILINNISRGDFDTKVETGGDEYLDSIEEMKDHLKHLSIEDRNNAWVNQHLTKLETILKTDTGEKTWMNDVITLLTRSVTAGAGVLYKTSIENQEESFLSISAYGVRIDDSNPRVFRMGQGQLGQLGIERKTVVINQVPESYLAIRSGLGSSAPEQLVLVPLLFKGELYGALEIGCFHPLQEFEMRWLEKACESLAAHFFNQRVNEETKRKLEDLAARQAQELVEIHRLQEDTYHTLELKLKEVEDEKVKNEAILEGCVDGVISFDESGKVHFCNHAAAEIFGASTEKISGYTIFDLLNIRLDREGNTIKPVLLTQNGEREAGIRTEVALKSLTGDDVDVLLTSTRVELQNAVYFTFFMQKISVDLF